VCAAAAAAAAVAAAALRGAAALLSPSPPLGAQAPADHRRGAAARAQRLGAPHRARRGERREGEDQHNRLLAEPRERRAIRTSPAARSGAARTLGARRIDGRDAGAAADPAGPPRRRSDAFICFALCVCCLLICCARYYLLHTLQRCTMGQAASASGLWRWAFARQRD